MSLRGHDKWSEVMRMNHRRGEDRVPKDVDELMMQRMGWIDNVALWVLGLGVGSNILEPEKSSSSTPSLCAKCTAPRISRKFSV